MAVPCVRPAPIRSPRRDSAANRARIVVAARAALADYGTDARMDDIAARAGVGVGTVYRHFPNKEVLIAELVRDILGDLISVAHTALARGDGSGLESFLQAVGASFAEHHNYADELMNQTQSDCVDLLRSLMVELLAQAIVRGRCSEQVRTDDLLATVWALRGVVRASLPGNPDAWRRHLAFHLEGLRRGCLPALT